MNTNATQRNAIHWRYSISLVPIPTYHSPTVLLVSCHTGGTNVVARSHVTTGQGVRAVPGSTLHHSLDTTTHRDVQQRAYSDAGLCRTSTSCGQFDSCQECSAVRLHQVSKRLRCTRVLAHSCRCHGMSRLVGQCCGLYHWVMVVVRHCLVARRAAWHGWISLRHSSLISANTTIAFGHCSSIDCVCAGSIVQ
jgi:hypothetical protein